MQIPGEGVMKKRKKIVIPRDANQKKKKDPFNAKMVRWVLFIFVVLFLYIWLKVDTDITLGKLQNLNYQESQLYNENQKLKAEVIRLSSYGRIKKIAKEKLGLDHLSQENKVYISADD